MTAPAKRQQKTNPGYLMRLEKVKDFIRLYWTANHYPPTIREISNQFHGASTSNVNRWLERLEKDGWLEERKFNTARNIVPVEIFADRPVFPSLYDGNVGNMAATVDNIAVYAPQQETP